MQHLDPHTDPDPLVRGLISKFSWIRNTADENPFPVSIVPVGTSSEMSDSDPRQSHTDRNTRLPLPLSSYKGCGSGWIRINLSCWIRIRIHIADPDPGGQISKLQFLIKKMEMKFTAVNFFQFRSSNPGSGSGIRIRNQKKCWIRIRIKSMRIRNPASSSNIDYTSLCREGFIFLPCNN